MSDIITNCFNVDFNNSLNQDERLSVDQIGYRSVHYVCDLGPTRSALPEFEGLSSLKFEIQVRTVLQHAWAELAHDRSYKFSGKLPAEIERHLFLYAGMLEIADKGFDELSLKIDEYAKEINSKSQIRDFNYQLDSISLPAFVKAWADANDIGLESLGKTEYDDLLHELHLMDV
ncbi:GTP pyrophosphokinase, partial [Klebsiella pneumoniae]